MTRHPKAQFEPGNSASSEGQDVLVLGWADGVDAGLLPGGTEALLAESINLRLESGRPETRLGCVTPRSFNPSGISTLRGAGKFSDPNSDFDGMVVADQAGKVWLLADGRTVAELSVSGVTIEGPVEFVQAFGLVVGFRGLGQEPMFWDGDPLHGWLPATALPQPPGLDYTRVLPKAEFGVMHLGRLWTALGQDYVVPSELIDVAKYDPNNVIRVNQGEAGRIVALVPFEKSRMIVLKDTSVHSIYNITGALDQYGADRHSDSHGCLARKSAKMVGAKCVWLGNGAVLSMNVTDQGELRVNPQPLSQPIRGFMARVNWRAAHAAAAQVLADRYYCLAVPVDGSVVNNCVLVYDLTTGQWVTADLFLWAPGPAGEITSYTREIPFFPMATMGGAMGGMFFAPGAPVQPVPVAGQDLLVVPYAGRPALAMVDGRRVIILNQNTGSDLVDGEEFPIRSVAGYRGIGGAAPNVKQLGSMSFSLETWDAAVAVSVREEGDRQARVIRTISSDRSQWRWWGVPPRDLSNAADDAHADGRQDYALYTSDEARLTDSGMPLFRLAPVMDGAPISCDARWASIRFESRRGHMVVTAVQTEFTERRPKWEKR